MDFITSLPEEWINGGSTFQRLINDKSINRRFHKKALARYLRSEEIYNRSFDIPWYTILKPRKRLLELLLKKLKSRGWYQSHTLDKIFGEFENQKNKAYELLELKSHGYRIFTLLSLEVWAMQYLDNVSFEGATLEDYLRT
jgi:asparagine synthase (glutamine-hydrolysing)